MFKVETLRKTDTGSYEATLSENSFDATCVISFEIKNGQLAGKLRSVDTLGLEGEMLASARNYLSSQAALTEAMNTIRRTITTSHK